jgi:hypothetical protein
MKVCFMPVRLCGQAGTMEPPMWGGLPRAAQRSKRMDPGGGRRCAGPLRDVADRSATPRAATSRSPREKPAPDTRRASAPMAEPRPYDERVVGARPVDAESSEGSRRVSAGSSEANEAKRTSSAGPNCSRRATAVRTSPASNVEDSLRVRAVAGWLISRRAGLSSGLTWLIQPPPNTSDTTPRAERTRRLSDTRHARGRGTAHDWLQSVDDVDLGSSQ